MEYYESRKKATKDVAKLLTEGKAKAAIVMDVCLAYGFSERSVNKIISMLEAGSAAINQQVVTDGNK
jgi:hypothetical protein